MSFDPWTLGLQTINVVILVWLLGHFFWRPVAAIIDARRAAIDGAVAEAERKRQAADAALAEIATTRAGLAAERQKVLADAHAESEEARGALLDKARAEADVLLAAARQEITARHKKTEEQWRSAAADLAVEISTRLLAPLATKDVQEAFAERLIETVATLPDSQKQSLLARPGKIELVAAGPTPEIEDRAFAKRLAAALDTDTEFNIRLDPNLIAGVDLVAPQFTVHNNWRADLQQLRERLDHARK